MTEHPTLPPRPVARGAIAAVIGGWLQWFGLARLVGGAVSVLIVCAGVLLLVQSPTPATEAALPVAAGGTVTSTLPPPSTSPVVLGTPPSSPPSTSAVAPPIVVHVAGAVVTSGVYQLPAPARVADAVAAAGGVAADGDLDAVNLAAAVVDGQRVYVPRLGEVDPARVPSGGNVAAGSAPGSTAAPGPLDLNAATAEQFEQLPGVGPATAAAIVNDRDLHGPFASVDDLDRVPGIGTAKLEALRELVTV